MAVYDRMAEYLAPGDYVLFTSQYGEILWLVIEADEPMGQIHVQFANDAVAIPQRAPRGVGAQVPPFQFIDADPVEIPFLEPQREDRMYQVRPSVFAIDRDTGELVDPDTIPPLVMLEWEYPSGARQGGTDRASNQAIGNIPNNGLGGPTGGRIPVNEIYTRSDLNPLFDLFLFYKTVPAFRVINWTRGIVGGAGAMGLQYNWYLAFQGRKYIFRRASPDEEQKLLNRELPYRSIISPGGISPTLLRGR